MNNFKDLSGFFAERYQSFVPLNQLTPALSEICHYALFPPGKCFRASLCLRVAQSLAVEPTLLLPFAAAVEVIHTATLVHDDLPALDDDDLRRGRASVHKQFGEASAVLCGDVLMALANCILLAEPKNAPGEPQPTPAQQNELLRLLNTTLVRVCDGQVLDLQAAGVIPANLPGLQCSAEAELELRHSLKTAALIQAAAEAALVFLDVAERERLQPHISEFSRDLGILFQITDDILEATSTAEILGKNIDSDQRNGTPTYVSVYGLERSKEIATSLAADAKAHLAADSRLVALAPLVDLVCQRSS